MRWVGSDMSVEVVVEGRERTDAANHDRHGVRVATEPLEEPRHLLVHHGVARHRIVEIRLLGLGGQLAVEQQVAGFQEVAMLGELLDRIATIKQDAFIPVDIGDLQLATRGRGETRIVGEHAGLRVELADIDHSRADRPCLHRQFLGLVVDDERSSIGLHGCAFSSGTAPERSRTSVQRFVRCNKASSSAVHVKLNRLESECYSHAGLVSETAQAFLPAEHRQHIENAR